MGDCKVYIGGLPTDSGASEVRIKEELEDAFSRYGRLRKVWVARRPPGFAFIEFEDHRDAEDSVRALDGTRIQGARIKVEVSHGRRRGDGPPGGGRGGSYGGGGYSSSRGRRSPSPRRGGRRSRSRSRSRSPRRSRSRSPRRSRSPPPRRPVSRSRSRSRSPRRSP